MPYEPIPGGDFKKALTKLANDAAYRKTAMGDPNTITHDFKLSLTELEALRDAAELSGADLTQVRKVRAESFQHLSGRPLAELKKASAVSWRVSCCSCCCCCCGETAVAPILHG